jgi:hypothetical protein
MPLERRQRRTAVTADMHSLLPPVNRPQQSYARRRKQQVVLFLLHHRIPSDRPKRGRPIADELPVEELGYRRPTFEEAAEYFKIESPNTVRGWWKARDKLLAGSKPRKHTPRGPQLEKELVKLFAAA